MNFIDFITSEFSKHKPERGLYGQNVPSHYYLKNVSFNTTLKIAKAKTLSISFYEKENYLEIDFNLLYKDYSLAEISIELYSPFEFEFIGNNNRVADLEEAMKQLVGEYDTLFKFELTKEKIIIQAKNEDLNFKFIMGFKKINIDIDFHNQVSFIDALEKRTKNNKLFYTICESIKDEQLYRIAKADYEYNAATCFEELKSIRDNQKNLKEISFSLSEVLSLTRYSDPTTIEEHQERIFACVIILLGDYESISFENFENVITAIFLSVTEFESDYLEQAQAFFINFINKEQPIYEVQLIAYLILGLDLILKDEGAFKDTFNFLQETKFLQEIDFELHVALTAKRVKAVTLILLQNTDFIKNEILKKAAKEMFESMIRVCEERYDLTAINAQFERTFTKNQQVDYLNLLPELNTLQYLDRPKFLLKKGLNSTQVEILLRSLFNAKMYIEGSDYEMELKRNVFFAHAIKTRI